MKNTNNALVSKPEAVHWFYLHRYMHFINPNVSFIPSFFYSLTHFPQQKCYHCEKRLPPAIVSPSALTMLPSSRHKKDEKLLSAHCELSGKYLSGEQGVIMLSERSKKKSQKRKEGRGNHDKSLTLLRFLHPGAAVQRLAGAGCG